MSLFICAKCGCVENTALSTYWFRKNLKYTDGLEEYQDKPLCSECGRAVKNDNDKVRDWMIPGRWHNRFPKVQATEVQKRNMRTNGMFE